MQSHNQGEKLLLLYDGHCRFCIFITKLLSAIGIINKSQLYTIQSISTDLLSLVDIERFRVELALIDPQSKEVHYGAQAIRLLVHRQYNWLEKLLFFKPLFWVVDQLYKVISYNRFFIIPAKEYKTIKCECEPPIHQGFRLKYIVLIGLMMILLAIPISWLWEVLMHVQISRPMIFLEALLIIFIPYFIYLLIIKLFSSYKSDHINHFTTLWLILYLGWLPSIITCLFPISELWLSQIILYNTILIAALGMYCYHKRIKAMGLTKKWLLIFALFFLGTNFIIAMFIGLIEAIRKFN